MIDLSKYFARIGYSASTAPTLETLGGLVRAHVESIPFENLDVMMGRPIDLAPEAIAVKLIDARRGGYCFEQNGLLLEVLTQLGFSVIPISARVRLQRPRDFTPPRTHAFLRVELEGESWLADVGVGALSPTAPLRLHLADEQPTPHEPRRIVEERPGLWFHQARLGDSWADVCEFTLEPMPMIDRELANWFTSAHPKSHFKNRLVVARAGPNGSRVSLLNRELSVRQADGIAQTRLLSSPHELLETLRARFGIDLPDTTELRCEGLEWG